MFFNRLLNVAGARSLRRIFNNDLLIQDSLLLRGHIEELRNLTTKGTVILTPTHHSNLDSILLGWAIHAVGVPALLYGAGLNLFNARGFDYFMNRLGAYKIDRRKKNSLYLETLKMYSRMTIQRGCHTLFFPGGTRSRSGQLESDLKMGLLGTVFDAQRFNLQYPAPEKPQKIFVVPLVISYHFVLEAASLIDEHLRSVGKERYYPPKDHFPSIAKSLLFVWKLFSAKSKVVLSFGKPMDLFGNDVDEAGNSIDRNGKEVEIKEYFMSNGQIAEDNQRDSEYTKILADKIVERFYKENRVLTSHLLAFAIFEILKKRHRRLDLFGLLRLSEEDTLIPTSNL
ncbi:MAG: 1-acyl-sn-glycerol-3-phosphate acyltransferase [Sphingobacteriales bacterium]|nr:1-acyl-sn-glycerol-3-phosphate acyltransferase [Sphingobacteriales bacterium]